jgi:pimeloyl-ACP methyl ester carboxylesterase
MPAPTPQATDPQRPITREPPDFETAHDALLAEYGIDAETRYVDVDEPPTTLRVVESTGDADGVPLVFVHGTAGFVGFGAPLLSRLDDVHWVAYDRPGYGLSDPFVYTRANVRETVVDSLRGVLDALGLDRVDLVGYSMGATTSLAFARDFPDRVRRMVLFGAPPGFPGTEPPLPFRLLMVPGLGRVLERFQSSGEEGVLEFADVFGEREGIRNHPALVRTIAAHEATPKCATAGESEFAAVIRPRGWYPSARIPEATLREVETPTTFVWGHGDMLGGPDDVRVAVGRMPDAHLLALDAGHVPFFEHPEWCAGKVREALGGRPTATEA